MDQTLTVDQIKKRAVSSFVSLTARQILLRAISFITLNIVLARALPVDTIGVFNIATGVVTFFAFFSDIGLAASLIQKKEAISLDDIKTVFSLQSLMVGVLSLLIIFGAGQIGWFYGLHDDGVWLVRALGLTFFLTSLKVVPSVLLERNLNFKPLVSVEVVETLIFNIGLVLFVFKGFGVWSYTYSTLARSVVGVILIYLLSPTKVRFGISRLAAKQLLSFGVPFQLNNLLSLLKDRLVPLVVARMVGPTGIGYVTWAQSLAWLPLEIMNIIIRIAFPTFSRLQHDREQLKSAVEKTLFVTTMLVYPAIFGLGGILPSLVSHVVSTKWQPAVQSYYLFAFATLWSVISTTLTNTLNAVGKIKSTLKLMVMWTVLEWLLTPLLVYFYGFIGVAMAAFMISFSSSLTIILVKRILPIQVLETVWLPLLASSAMGGIVLVLSTYLVTNWWTLVVMIVLGGAVYAGLVWLFGSKRLIRDWQSLQALRRAS